MMKYVLPKVQKNFEIVPICLYPYARFLKAEGFVDFF